MVKKSVSISNWFENQKTITSFSGRLDSVIKQSTAAECVSQNKLNLFAVLLTVIIVKPIYVERQLHSPCSPSKNSCLHDYLLTYLYLILQPLFVVESFGGHATNKWNRESTINHCNKVFGLFTSSSDRGAWPDLGFIISEYLSKWTSSAWLFHYFTSPDLLKPIWSGIFSIEHTRLIFMILCKTASDGIP